MSNKHIAIEWAAREIRRTPGFIYSDQFFQPFSNQQTRAKIVQELEKRGVYVCSDTKEGAFIFRKNDSRFRFIEAEGLRGGVWQEGENVMILPLVPVDVA